MMALASVMKASWMSSRISQRMRRRGNQCSSAGWVGRAEKDQPRLAPRRSADPSAWHNAFNWLQRCYERREIVINAFFDLADSIITLRNLIRRVWTTHCWDTRPPRCP
jgi:hypothetical protein